VILSKMTRVSDPLNKHLEGRGFACAGDSVQEAFASVGQSTEAAGSQRPGPVQQAAIQLLSAMPGNKATQEAQGSVAHLHSHFAKKMSESAIQGTR